MENELQMSEKWILQGFLGAWQKRSVTGDVTSIMKMAIMIFYKLFYEKYAKYAKIVKSAKNTKKLKWVHSQIFAKSIFLVYIFEISCITYSSWVA